MILKTAMKKTSTRHSHHHKRLVRVQFRDYITVIPFHKVSRDEAKEIWMTDADLTRNKNIGIQIAYTYRRMIEREQHLVSIKQQQQQQEQEQQEQEQEQEQEGRTRLPASSPSSPSSYIPPSSSSAKIAADCRGFECCTVLRNRNKFLLNRWALHYANNSNNWEMKNKNTPSTSSTSNTTAMLYYQKCNAWSTKVGLVQAIHDYMEVYGNEASFVSSHEHNNRTTSRGKNGDNTKTRTSITKSRKLEALQKLPPVWSMIPPTAAYYERHVARAQQQLQEQQQAQSQSPPRSSTVVASRKRTRPQSQGEGRTVSPSLSPPRTGTTATSTVSYSPCVTSRSHIRRRLNIVVVE